MGLFDRLFGPSKPRILAVEDDRQVSELLKDLLTAAGYHVDVAGDGLAGLELYKANKYALVILDGRLPKLSGTGLLALIREIPRGAAQKVIMLSAEDQVAAIDQADHLGIVEWVSKPFSPEKLAAKVAEHIGRV